MVAFGLGLESKFEVVFCMDVILYALRDSDASLPGKGFLSGRWPVVVYVGKPISGVSRDFG